MPIRWISLFTLHNSKCAERTSSFHRAKWQLSAWPVTLYRLFLFYFECSNEAVCIENSTHIHTYAYHISPHQLWEWVAEVLSRKLVFFLMMTWISCVKYYYVGCWCIGNLLTNHSLSSFPIRFPYTSENMQWKYHKIIITAHIEVLTNSQCECVSSKTNKFLQFSKRSPTKWPYEHLSEPKLSKRLRLKYSIAFCNCNFVAS